MAPATESVMGALPRDKAGVGSAVNDTTRQVGGALGVAIIGSTVTSIYANRVAPVADEFGLDPGATDAAESSPGRAQTVAGSLGDSAGAFVAEVNEAFTGAMTTGMRISAVVIMGAALMAWRFLPARATSPDDEVVERPVDVDDIEVADDVGVLAPVAGE